MDFYPAARYCRDGRMVIVPDQEASEALGPGWADTPARWYPENQTVHSVTVEGFAGLPEASLGFAGVPEALLPVGGDVPAKRRPGRPRKV